MNELALFAGMGGGILGGRLLGWRTVCAVEINDYCRRILMQRQDDGILEPFPIWDDITTFDGSPWAGCVDIVTGGFPCQDISAAGKGAGIDGERSGLWREMARVIGEVRPRYVLVENSPVLTVRGLGTVLGDLAALGYDAEWGVLGAADLGAPHKRDRIWIVAHDQKHGRRPGRAGRLDPGDTRQPEQALQAMAHAMRDRREADHGRQSVPDEHGHGAASTPGRQIIESWAGSAMPMANPQPPDFGNHRTYPDWPADPAETPEFGVGRVVDGCPARVDRLKALGNGQVPRVAAAAFTVLERRLNDA